VLRNRIASENKNTPEMMAFGIANSTSPSPCADQQISPKRSAGAISKTAAKGGASSVPIEISIAGSAMNAAPMNFPKK
jgi:hypothetical protein